MYNNIEKILKTIKTKILIEWNLMFIILIDTNVYALFRNTLKLVMKKTEFFMRAVDDDKPIFETCSN